MYKLTLTKEERKAIDWIGNRYFHGNNLRSYLIRKCEFPDILQWNSEEDATFLIPENIAWQIRAGFEDENFEFACFSDELKTKLIQFCDQIV